LALTTLGRRTDESGSGSWRDEWTTPQAHDIKGAQSAKRASDPKHLGQCLVYDVKKAEAGNWLTPKASDDRAKGTSAGDMLQNQAAENWPTATARDYRSVCASEATNKKNSRPLSEVVGQQGQASCSTNGKPRGSLNSAWVMQLMGWPDEYAAELTRLLCEWSATHGVTRSRK